MADCVVETASELLDALDVLGVLDVLDVFEAIEDDLEEASDVECEDSFSDVELASNAEAVVSVLDELPV